MNKLVAVPGIIIILLSVGCGILYYQIGDMQSQNSELQNQISQLENQTSELESQLDDLELQNLELQNQTSDLEAQLSFLTNASLLVRITGFEITVTGNPVLMQLMSSVNVTVQNFGTMDIEVLSLSVKHISGNFPTTTKPIGPILAGETKTVETSVEWGYGVKSNFVATLVVYNATVDTYYPTNLDEHFH